MMKKLTVFLAAGLLAAALVPGTAQAGKKAARQEVAGHIAMQAPPADATDNPNGCYSGVHRRIAVASQMQINGIVGFHFEIDPATWGKNFRLTPVTPGVDIDITFYDGFGSTEQAAEPSYAPATLGFEERNTEGEVGKVPANMTLAIVCMKSGQNADVLYEAGAGVK
jgi:hypothetical protein